MLMLGRRSRGPQLPPDGTRETSIMISSNMNRTLNSTVHRTCTGTMHITTHMTTKGTIFVIAPTPAKGKELRRKRGSPAREMCSSAGALLALLLLPAIAFAQRDAKIPDPDPEVERK